MGSARSGRSRTSGGAPSRVPDRFGEESQDSRGVLGTEHGAIRGKGRANERLRPSVRPGGRHLARTSPHPGPRGSRSDRRTSGAPTPGGNRFGDEGCRARLGWAPLGVTCRETHPPTRDGPRGASLRRAAGKKPASFEERRRSVTSLADGAGRDRARECAKGSVDTAEPTSPTEGFGQKARASRGPGRHG